tara:strand:- start:911 stop:1282 length:372 start_codon:yes stop_codon:yes gene_type:complete
MFKSKYTIAAILIFIIISVSNIFSIVYVEYNAVSLVEFRKHRIECGPLLQILNNDIDYSSNNLLSMNRTSCKQIATVTLITSIGSILFLTIVLIIFLKYIKNKKQVEDLTDLLRILKKRNNII